MSRPVGAAPALRVCSCLTALPDLLPEVESALVEVFGEVGMTSGAYEFPCGDYYRDELGDGIRRTWYLFRRLCRPERLAESRRLTGAIEARFARDERRRVNLDPGYLDHGKLVLASRKEAPDKLYLGEGVWAHTCLRYHDGGFEAPVHSFPDFRDGRFARFMMQARALYKSLLRETQASGAG